MGKQQTEPLFAVCLIVYITERSISVSMEVKGEVMLFCVLPLRWEFAEFVERTQSEKPLCAY